MTHYSGQLAGIAASLAWSISCLVFSRVAVPAGALNLFKNTVAASLFLLTLGGLSFLGGRTFLSADAAAWGWLVLSGGVGIVIGDLFYFRSLQILGARRALVLTTLAPPAAGVFAWWFLGETLPDLAILGILITLSGVAIAVRDPSLESDAPGHYPGSSLSGIGFGFLGSVCQALQSVFSKLGMRDTVDPLEASCIRLTTAAALGLLAGLCLGRLGEWRNKIFQKGVAPRLTGAAICGTYMGIWLSLVAFKNTQLAVAATLTALSPVFVLPIARVFLGLRLSPRAVLGVVVALSGVALFFLAA